ncbi:hypothetical protein ACUH92_08925 [Dermabacteraceae bacterium CCM 9520]
MRMPLSRIIPEDEDLLWVDELKKEHGEDVCKTGKGIHLCIWGKGNDCEACFVLERLKQAKEEDAEVTPIVKGVAEEVGGKCESLNCRIKSPESMFRKVTARNRLSAGHEHDHDADSFEDSTKDVIRFTIAIKNHDDLLGALKNSIRSFRERGMPVENIADGYKQGNTYKGIHLAVRSKRGTLIEVQLHSDHSLAVKNSTHEAYEVYRDSSIPPALRMPAMMECMEKSSSVPQPKGIDEIYPRGGENGEKALFMGVQIVKKYYR